MKQALYCFVTALLLLSLTASVSHANYLEILLYNASNASDVSHSPEKVTAKDKANEDVAAVVVGQMMLLQSFFLLVPPQTENSHSAPDSTEAPE
jgi:hypothetical protein